MNKDLENELLVDYGKRVMGHPITIREVLVSHEFLCGQYKLLEEYIKEMGQEMGQNTLSRLINSHRYLRSLNLEDINTRQSIIREETQKLIDIMGDRGFVSKDELRGMTIEEIYKLLYSKE